MLHSNQSMKGWIISTSLYHPKKTIFCSLLITMILMSGLQFLVIDDDMMKMLPKNIESRVIWDSIQKDFGSTEIIYIAFGNKSKEIYTQDAFATLWDIANGLNNIKSVEGFSSLATQTKIDNVDGLIDAGELQPKRLLELNEINDIKLYLERNNKLKRRFVSKDDEFFLVTVEPIREIGLNEFRVKHFAVKLFIFVVFI